MPENTEPNFKPENKPENRIVLPMNKVIEFLKNRDEISKEDYLKKPAEEYEISGEISPDNLRSLVQLNFEIELTEENNKIVLSVGCENGGRLEEGERRDSSKLSFHTHTEKKGETTKNTPSFSDTYISSDASPTTPLVLAHGRGIMVYHKPFLDPVTKEKTNECSRDLMLTYCDSKSIALYKFFRKNKKFRLWKDLSDDEQINFERDFAERTGMILEEAEWENKEGVKKIMDYINLKRDFSVENYREIKNKRE